MAGNTLPEGGFNFPISLKGIGGWQGAQQGLEEVVRQRAFDAAQERARMVQDAKTAIDFRHQQAEEDQLAQTAAQFQANQPIRDATVSHLNAETTDLGNKPDQLRQAHENAMALASQNNDWATVRAHQAAIDALDRQNQQNTFVGGQNDLTRKNALTIAGMPARSQLGPGGGGAGGISPDVINNIAEGIVSGKQPPVLTGLYRMAGPVRSALQERGFDLSSAQQDWSASQRWINTVNSTQYKGLRDSIQFTQNSIPMVRDLVTQWDSAGLPLLSAANLALAKSGAKGQDAQELARKLDGAMGEMQANLATIYRSGYSPTNTALESAAKSLSGDWSRKAALGSLDQIERIVSYRDQAMQQVGPMTGRDENQYAPRGNAPPPDTGGASGNLPPVTSSWTIDANGNPVKKAPGASSSGGAKYDEFGNPIR